MLVCFGPAGTWPHWWRPVWLAGEGRLAVNAALLPGRASRLGEAPLDSVTAMAADALEWVESIARQPRSHVVGVCSGSLVAFEVAALLAEHGGGTVSLHLFDLPVPAELSGVREPRQITELFLTDGSIPSEVASSEAFDEMFAPALHGDLQAAMQYDASRLAVQPELRTYVYSPVDSSRHRLAESWRGPGASFHRLPSSSRELVSSPESVIPSSIWSALED